MQSDCSNLKRFLDSIEDLDGALIDRALTHSSLASDNSLSYSQCNERLEFLGDAVLKLIASEYLYNKFPEYKEGELSNIRSYIVSDENLSQVALKIGLAEQIKVSKTDKTLQHNESISACALEAVLGALFISNKTKEIKEFFEYNFSQVIDDIAQKKMILNPKAILQEFTQSDSKQLPKYKIINESGAAHAKVFDVEVSYNDEALAIGSGKTKKAAQQDAALKASEKLGLLDVEK